jgi:hypothetical protein
MRVSCAVVYCCVACVQSGTALPNLPFTGSPNLNIAKTLIIARPNQFQIFNFRFL